MKLLFSMQPSNDLGLLAQALPVARELRRRGHETVFCRPGRAAAKAVAADGFNSVGLGCPVYNILTGDTRFTSFLKLLGAMHLKRDLGMISWYARHMSECAASEIWDIDHYAYVMGMGSEGYVRAVTEALSKLIARYKPDAVVNFWNPFMSIAARVNKIPLVSVIQPDLHPLSRGFIWWKDRSAGLPSPVPAINSILLGNNLPAIASVGDLFLGGLTLAVGTREMEPLPDAAGVSYLGPLLISGSDEKLPKWAEGLGGKPVIWVYPGNLSYIKGHESPFDGMVILKACIEALKDFEAHVVVTTGYHALPGSVLPLPRNFRHAAFLPGLAMAGKSDLVIHHGGYGSCQTCLYAGAPAVIVPTYSERESNARRVAAAGAGEFILPSADVSGKRKRLDANELRDKVGRALSEPSYRENAKRISECMKKYGGASGAADLIEGFLAGRPAGTE